jgi:hypothetical protein
MADLATQEAGTGLAQVAVNAAAGRVGRRRCGAGRTPRTGDGRRLPRGGASVRHRHDRRVHRRWPRLFQILDVGSSERVEPVNVADELRRCGLATRCAISRAPRPIGPGSCSNWPTRGCRSRRCPPLQKFPAPGHPAGSRAGSSPGALRHDRPHRDAVRKPVRRAQGGPDRTLNVRRGRDPGVPRSLRTSRSPSCRENLQARIMTR